MAIVAARVNELIIPETCDRHANKADIYKTSAGRYHINFRNLQIRLTKQEFQEWKRGLKKAQENLGDRMMNDELLPWTEEDEERWQEQQERKKKARQRGRAS